MRGSLLPATTSRCCKREIVGKQYLLWLNLLAMDVVVSMPDPVARQWGDTPQAIGGHVIEDAVIERYRAGRLSHRRIGETLGLDYLRTESFLKERGVPLNYLASDLEADAATLEKNPAALVSVVISDTSLLHYLILCGVDSVLPRLFERVIIPPTVFAELQHPNGSRLSPLNA